MNTQEIVSEINSRDKRRVWLAACEIIEHAQTRDEIIPLIPYLAAIKKETQGLKMGGAFASNKRFVDHAIRIIEFYESANGCSCALYLDYEMNDPEKEALKDNVTIIETIKIEDKWIDYSLVKCNNCNKVFKVTERMGHYRWWKWEYV